MTAEVISLLTQSSGAALVTGMFLWYLVKQDKRSDDRQNQFNTIITDYLKENTKSQVILSEKLQDFAEASREHKSMLEKLYVQLVQKRDTINDYEKQLAKIKKKSTRISL